MAGAGQSGHQRPADEAARSGDNNAHGPNNLIGRTLVSSPRRATDPCAVQGSVAGTARSVLVSPQLEVGAVHTALRVNTHFQSCFFQLPMYFVL